MAATFRDWVKTERLEQHTPLDHFRDTHIAIDAHDYLDAILTNLHTREPLLSALGGLPFALQKYVDADLSGFEAAGITPVFVFNGLDVASMERTMLSTESKRTAAALNEAWSIYDQGRGDDAVAAFGKVCTYKTAHIARWLYAHLHKAGITVQTAPYIAAAQMVYLEEHSYVDAVAGSASLLVFGADKVLTHFDWEARRVAWADIRQCMGKLLLNREPFADLMLLSGCSILPPLPDLMEMEHERAVSKLQAARSAMSRANNDGYAVCLQQKDDDYTAAFRKARFVVKHAVALTGAGKIEPKDAAKVPNDVHEFVGQRLPEEVYYYLSRGVFSPRVLNWRVRMQVMELPPLDGGNSQVYKDLVQDKLRPLRAQALALLTRGLHRYYQKTDVDLVCWFNDTDKRPLGIPDMTDVTNKADGWHVTETVLAKGPSVPDCSKMPLLYAIGFLHKEGMAQQTLTPRQEGQGGMLAQPRELLANVTWRFLHDRGHMNPDHTLSGWGEAFHAGLSRAQAENLITPDHPPSTHPSETEEALLLALELLRLDLLTTKPLFPTPPFSGPPLRGSDTDKAHTLLISRVAGLALFRHHAIGYTGPLSRHLLAYHQVAGAVRASLRDLLEMHAANMLLSGAVDRRVPPRRLTDLGATLPLGREPDLGLALVVKSHLDELLNEEGRRSDIVKWFNHAKDIQGDLERAWSLWASVNAAVQATDTSIVSTSTRETFQRADDWLQKMRARTPVPEVNGAT